MIKYLNGTKQNYLDNIADDLKVVTQCMDKSFEFDLDFKSHTGEIMTMGQEEMQ